MPEKNTPDVLSPAVKAMRPDLEFIRNVEAGWPTVATKFLSKFGAEHPDDFKARQARPDFEDFLNPVLDAAAGRVFSREPVLTGDARAAALWDDIDGRGNRGNIVAFRMVRDALVAGQHFVLVDYPQVGDVNLPVPDRQAIARAYWCSIPLDRVTNFAFAYVGGRSILTLFAFYEQVEQRSGFLVKLVDQWRVFRHNLDSGVITYELWRRKDNLQSADPVLFQEPQPISGPDAIPVVSINLSAAGDFVSSPPFLALAQSSINFYRTTSDMNRAHELTSYPTLFGKGISDKTPEGEPLAVGPGTRVLTENKDAALEYVNGDGRGVELGLKLRETIRSGMAITGLSFLEQDTRQAETATAKALDEQSDSARIRQWTEILEDSLNLAWVFTAAFEGIQPPTIAFATQEPVATPPAQAGAEPAPVMPPPPPVLDGE